MKRSEKTVLGLTGIASLAAMLMAFAPAKSIAQAFPADCNGCLYDGGCFSNGACVKSACSTMNETCNSGNWTCGCP